MHYVAFYKLFDNNVEDCYKQGIFLKLKFLGTFRVIIRARAGDNAIYF